MGHGIAYLLAAAGHHGRHLRAVGRSARIVAAAARRRSADLLGDDPALPRRHLRRTISLRPAVQDADFVFEAAPEKLPLKQQIFAELEAPHHARHHPRQQFVGHPLDRDRPPPQASRARGRHAFLESAASGAAGRGDPEREDQRRRRRAHHGHCCATPARQPVHVRRTFPASSATACSTRSSARRSRWSPTASAMPRPLDTW